MQQHGSKHLPADPPMPLTRSIGQKSTFSEHGHGAYQIKGNHGCSKMVSHILLADTPQSKVNLGVEEMEFICESFYVFFFCLVFALSLCASVYMCFVVTC